MIRRAAAWLLATSLAAPIAGAQVVRGRALAPDSGAVGGVVVQLVDSAGRTVSQAFSDRRGAFLLRAPGPATYRLRALRIGWRPSLGAPFVVPAPGATRDLVLDGGPIALGAVNVSATSACVRASDTTGAGFAAWEQARQALLAARLTRDERALRMRWVHFERHARPADDSTYYFEEVEGETAAPRAFQAYPVTRLAANGYVERGPVTTTFAAPDEDVLLSPEFAESHCLRGAVSEAGADSVVVAFEPTPERTQPEVAGHFVLERATGELRRLAFHYVHVEPDEEAARAGGEVHFRRLPDGRWLVDAWVLRLARFERQQVQRVSPSPTGLRGANVSLEWRRVLTARETFGGDVYWIAGDSGVVWSGGVAPIAGHVVDSLGRAMPGATITLVGTSATALTDSAGAFRLEGARLGRRTLRVSPAIRDSLGADPVLEVVDAARDAPDLLVLLPTREQMIARVCAAANDARDGGFVRGIARDAYGGRLGGAEIDARWPSSAGGVVTRTVRASATGDYLLCGVPAGVPVHLALRGAAGEAGDADARVSAESGFALVDVRARSR